MQCLVQIIAMASAGNVVGLQRMLGRFNQLHQAVRERLEKRLSHETGRAQRLQVGGIQHATWLAKVCH
jgi:hypothetical protein